MNWTTVFRSQVILVLIAWAVSLFLTYGCSGMFILIMRDHYKFTLWSPFVVIMSIVQFLPVSIEMFQRQKYLTTMSVIMRINLALDILLTNYSMAFTSASVTFVIKMTEPLVMAGLRFLVLRMPVPYTTLLAIPTVIIGALLFKAPSSALESEITGLLLPLSTNFLAVVRKLAWEFEHVKEVQFAVKLRSIYALFTFEALCVLCLAMLNSSNALPEFFSTVAAFLFGLGFFHFSEDFISRHVQKVIDPSIRPLLNVSRKVVVVVCILVFDQRKTSATELAGLFLITFGITTNAMDVMSHASTTPLANSGKIRTQSARITKTSQLVIFALFTTAGLSIVLKQRTLFKTSSPDRLSSLTEHELSVAPEHKKSMNEDAHDFEPSIVTFLSWRLINHPDRTNMRSRRLTTNSAMIAEAQRVLLNLLADVIGSFNHVILLCRSPFDDKADGASTLGTLRLLKKMSKTVAFFCHSSNDCSSDKNLDKAWNASQAVHNDVAILVLVGDYKNASSQIYTFQGKIMKTFPSHTIVFLSHSILQECDADECRQGLQAYSNHSNVFLFLRDLLSYRLVEKNCEGVKFLLAPDMAFGIGAVQRHITATYDVIWLRNSEDITQRYAMPSSSSDLSVYVSDWTSGYWAANAGGSDEETEFIATQAGLDFLQRGRVVVTDRLHGHILSVLMNLPHVFIEDTALESSLSSFTTWTQLLRNVFLANNGNVALQKAALLLRRFDDYKENK